MLPLPPPPLPSFFSPSTAKRINNKSIKFQIRLLIKNRYHTDLIHLKFYFPSFPHLPLLSHTRENFKLLPLLLPPNSTRTFHTHPFPFSHTTFTRLLQLLRLNSHADGIRPMGGGETRKRKIIIIIYLFFSFFPLSPATFFFVVWRIFFNFVTF